MLKPMQAANDKPVLSKINYPVLTSTKFDGVRFLIVDGKFLSKKMEPLHPVVTKRFKDIVELATSSGVILDGEICAEGMKFHEITAAMAHEEDVGDLKLYVFDMVTVAEWKKNITWKNKEGAKAFEERVVDYQEWCDKNDPNQVKLVPVHHTVCHNEKAVQNEFDFNVKGGMEGIMLHCPKSPYIHSRATAKQNIFWKMKQWTTISAKIVDFGQKGILTEEAKKTNTTKDNLGRTKRGHKKADRELVDEVGTVFVEIIAEQGFPEGLKCGVGFAKEAYDIRTEITWKNRKKYLGRHVDIVFQDGGIKDKPRFGRIVAFRPDLDEPIIPA